MPKDWGCGGIQILNSWASHDVHDVGTSLISFYRCSHNITVMVMVTLVTEVQARRLTIKGLEAVLCDAAQEAGIVVSTVWVCPLQSIPMFFDKFQMSLFL